MPYQSNLRKKQKNSGGGFLPVFFTKLLGEGLSINHVTLFSDLSFTVKKIDAFKFNGI